MKSEKVNKLLTERGYKAEAPNGFDSEATVGHYYKIDRTLEVSFCLCNDKQPQFAVKESFIAADTFSNGNPDWHTFEIGITNEAPQGWLNCKFYSLSEKDILKNIETYENALMKMWSALFEKS